MIVVGRGISEVDELGLDGGEAHPLFGLGVAALLVFPQAVPSLHGEVEPSVIGASPFKDLDHALALLVVGKAPGALHLPIENLFSGVTVGRVPEIVGKGDGLAEGFVEVEGGSERPGNLVDLEGVSHPGSQVVPYVIDEDLSLVHQPAEGRTMDDAVPVPLEAGSPGVGLLIEFPAEGIRGQGCGRVQLGAFSFFFCEAVHGHAGGRTPFKLGRIGGKGQSLTVSRPKPKIPGPKLSTLLNGFDWRGPKPRNEPNPCHCRKLEDAPHR